MGLPSNADRPLEVLHLEDSPRDAELVRERLADLGHVRVDWAANEQEFESFLRRNEYDVILADYELPGFDAPEALRLAAALRPGTPFICVSGAIGEDRAVELLKQGATDYLRKDRLERLPLKMRRAVEEADERKARQRMEEALRESELRYRRLHESMRDAFVLVDMSGRILETNRAYQEMVGYDAAELTGLTYADLTPERWHAFEARLVTEEVLRRGHSEVYQKEYVRKNGTQFPVELRRFVLRNEAGEPTGTWAIVRDITERRRLEEQLRGAQRMDAIGRLAGGVAHDFNNALAVILGFSERALRRLDPLDPLYHDLGEIVRTVERSASLTRQLLAFARRQIVAPRVLGLNDAIASLANMLPRLIGEDVDLQIAPGEGLWNVKIDPSQVDQVLVNLATNARDAIPDVGTITVRTSNLTVDDERCRTRGGLTPGEYVLLTVSDTGVGMDETTRGQVFEPFFTTKPEGKGTGLGLATVYGIVKQNGGFIDVRSEPGRGATFEVYLPRFAGEAERPAEKRDERPLTGTETVLLVEDEPALLQIVQETLESLGYTVLGASSPGDAILLCEKHAGEIHVLLTDVVMPTMNGKKLKERLERIQPGLRALFMSGYTANTVTHRGIVDADLFFIQKPFTREVLALKIREALRG